MQPKFSAKNQNHCIMQRTHFCAFWNSNFVLKNENWTFLKMSKSEKSLTKFENEIAHFGNLYNYYMFSI